MDKTEETVEAAEAVEAVEIPETYTTETPANAVVEKKPRPALTVGGNAVGRRKQAIARVRLVPGSGNYTVNGRTLEAYFPNKLHQQLINDPFTVLDLGGSYDVVARITGHWQCRSRTSAAHRRSRRPQDRCPQDVRCVGCGPRAGGCHEYRRPAAVVRSRCS